MKFYSIWTIQVQHRAKDSVREDDWFRVEKTLGLDACHVDTCSQRLHCTPSEWGYWCGSEGSPCFCTHSFILTSTCVVLFQSIASVQFWVTLSISAALHSASQNLGCFCFHWTQFLPRLSSMWIMLVFQLAYASFLEWMTERMAADMSGVTWCSRTPLYGSLCFLWSSCLLLRYCKTICKCVFRKSICKCLIVI